MANTDPYRGKWLTILFLLGLLHVILDARYRIVSLFPATPIGYAVLGVIFFIISLALISPLNSFGRLSSPLDSWIRRKLRPIVKGMQQHRLLTFGVVTIMVLAGCWFRWLFIKQLPIEPRYADMLPLIRAACEKLTNGENPYGFVYPMPWVLPMTYWPGLWLPYWVPHVLSVDLRWVHLVVIACVSPLFCWFLKGSGKHNSPLAPAAPIAAFSALFLFLFSSESIIFANIGHTPPLWMWVSLLAFAVIQKRFWMSAIMLGILLASRQTAVVYAPLVAIYWFRASASWRTTGLLSLGACGTYLVLCGPFLALTPHAFLIDPMRHYTVLGNWDFTKGGTGFCANTIGLSYMIRCLREEWLLPLASALAVIVPCVLAWWRLNSRSDLLLYMGFAGMASALTAPIPWHYEYFPPLILFAFASIAAAIEEDDTPST